MTMTGNRYDIFESGNGAGVLLSHGITGAPAEMKPLIRRLAAAGFTVSCPALAGHCSPLRELERTRWTDWYASLAPETLSVQGQCDGSVVRGCAMASWLAWQLGADHPEAVQGVATLPATFFYDG